MPLENATYIHDLVSTNPAATDQMGQGYQQIQLVKAVLKAQFPNWTSAVLNSTQAQIDGVTGMVSANYFTIPAGTIAGDGGHVVLKAATSFTDIQLLNSSSAFMVWGGAGGTNGAGSSLFHVDATGNAVAAAGMFAPNGFLTGAAMATQVSWVGEIRIHGGTQASIPTGWHLCDGTNGTPDLRDKFVVGAGLDYAVGAQGGQNTHVLAATEMPSHNHTATDAGHGHTVYDPGHNHNVNDPTHAHSVAAGVSNTGNFGAGGAGPYPNGAAIATAAAYTGIFLSAAVTGIGVAAGYANVGIGYAGGGAAHENRPPYYALCYVMRIV